MRNGLTAHQRVDMTGTGKASVVIASAVAESRWRWSRRLEETFAVCKVAERRALEQAAATLKPQRPHPRSGPPPAATGSRTACPSALESVDEDARSHRCPRRQRRDITGPAAGGSPPSRPRRARKTCTEVHAPRCNRQSIANLLACSHLTDEPACAGAQGARRDHAAQDARQALPVRSTAGEIEGGDIHTGSALGRWRRLLLFVHTLFSSNEGRSHGHHRLL